MREGGGFVPIQDIVYDSGDVYLVFLFLDQLIVGAPIRYHFIADVLPNVSGIVETQFGAMDIRPILKMLLEDYL